LWRATIAILLLIAAAASGVSYAYSQKEQSQLYITAPIERGSIASVVKATGTINPISTVAVSSQLAGRVAEVLVGFNDTVTAGQLLGRLDAETYAARVQEARASLKTAKARVLVQRSSLERAKAALASARVALAVSEENLIGLKAKLEETERLIQMKLELSRSERVSKADLSRSQVQREAEAAEVRAMAEQVKIRREAIVMADADVRTAEANIENAEAVVEEKQAGLEQAELDLAHTELRAPVDGVIVKRDVNAGQTVGIGLKAKTLFKIANDLREMEVHGKIDEADIGRVKPGQKVDFTVDAYPGRVFAGRVRQVRMSPEVVHNVVTYTVVISAPNPERLLLPGMTASLRVVINESTDVLKLPNQALRFWPKEEHVAAETQGHGSATVWVVGKDGRPSRMAVTLGLSDSNYRELLSGPLSQGQPVIVGTAPAARQLDAFGFRLEF
jgi:HlyD family secretion protein